MRQQFHFALELFGESGHQKCKLSYKCNVYKAQLFEKANGVKTIQPLH